MFALTPLEAEALRLSLLVSGWAVAASLPLGISCAWLLARFDFPGKTLVDGVIHLPLVLPPVVVGYFLLVTLGRRGPVGAWLHETLGITLAFKLEGRCRSLGGDRLPPDGSRHSPVDGEC